MFFCSLLDSEVLVVVLLAMLLHKWSGNKKAQAHSVAPWQHIKYIFAFVGLRDTGCLNPHSDASCFHH